MKSLEGVIKSYCAGEGSLSCESETHVVSMWFSCSRWWPTWGLDGLCCDAGFTARCCGSDKEQASGFYDHKGDLKFPLFICRSSILNTCREKKMPYESEKTIKSWSRGAFAHISVPQRFFSHLSVPTEPKKRRSTRREYCGRAHFTQNANDDAGLHMN